MVGGIKGARVGGRLTDLTLEASMAKGAHNVGVVQVLGEGHLHGGPIWGALYVLVLLWSNDLQHIASMALAQLTFRFSC